MRKPWLALLFLLGAFHSKAMASEFCTNGHYGTYACFPTHAQAEQYIYSSQPPYPFLDADLSMLKLYSARLTSSPSGVPEKMWSYWYGDVAPKVDFGAKWTPTCDGGGVGCGGEFDSPQAAFEAGRAAFLAAGIEERPLFVRQTPGTNYLEYDFRRYSTVGDKYRQGLTQWLGSTHHCTYQNGPPGSGDYCIRVSGAHRWACPDTHDASVDRPSPAQVGSACSYREGGAEVRAENEPFDGDGNCSLGNPCHPVSGTKSEAEIDFHWPGLEYSRTYTSSTDASAESVLGPNWATPFDYVLTWYSAGNKSGFFIANAGRTELYLTDAASGYSYSQNSAGARLRYNFTDNSVVLEPNSHRRITLLPIGPHYQPITIEDLSSGITLQFSYCSIGTANCPTDRLVSVISNQGRKLGMRYATVSGAQGQPIATRLVGVDVDGQPRVDYAYDASGRLSGVTYPGATGLGRTYRYNQTGRTCVAANGNALSPCYLAGNRALLTGRVDEAGLEFGVYKYDNYGRVVSSEHPGGAERVTLSYPSVGSSQVIDQNGGTTSYSGAIAGSFRKLGGSTAGSLTTSSTYDGNGFPDRRTERNGAVTDYDYNGIGQVIRVAHAAGTPQEQVETTTWDPASNLPLATARTGQRVTRTFNARNQPLTVTTTDLTVTPNQMRTEAYRYCEQADVVAGTCPLVGQLLSVDGPRTDVSDITSYSYYPADDAACAVGSGGCRYRIGDLWKVTNALGQVNETQAYDDAGRAMSVKDSNGVVTDLEYSPRGWLTARKVRGLDDSSEADDAITRLEYDDIGQITKVTQPDGTYLRFLYDPAHRLTSVIDAQGNSITYTLDVAGNRTKEETKDSLGALKQTVSRVFNALGQLQTLRDAYGKSTNSTYDALGNTDTVTDPLSRVTDSNYDALGRLIQTIANQNRRGTDQATSGFQYDARDNLTAVVDPKGLTTAYTYNGFDEVTRLVSPDTGITNFDNDAAGNRRSQSDARGVLTSYAYDALNRLTSINGPNTAQNVQYAYDVPTVDCLAEESYSTGRLSQQLDESGSTRYCYDRRGNLVRKVQAITGGTSLTTGISYDAAGHISAMTYPSGAVVAFLRDANGRISRVDAVPSASAQQVTLVKVASYLPFGPLNSLTFGNDRLLSKAYDQNYGIDRVSDSSGVGLNLDMTLDSVGNVTTLSERTTATTTVSRTFTVDGLDRLTAQKNGKTVVESFGYDATGNRTSKGSTAYAYPAGSHRLSSVGGVTRSYDPAGNTASIGSGASAPSFVYDDRGRLREYRLGSVLKASYRLNGRGERVLKADAVAPSNSRQFVYDEAGHLLGEYMLDGQRIREYVWLDDVLVAVLGDFDNSAYQLVETDHLGTPRAVVHPSKNIIVWRWDLNPTAFGEHAPNSNPDGDGLSYVLNLRLPGQYYDAETGFYHNGVRDYEPGTGRYPQSDPSGLRGGISTYGYALQTPLTAIDPTGLEARLVDIPPTNQRPAGSIYCVDGVIRPFFMWNQWPPDFSQCSEVRDCVYAHEMSHVGDAYRSNPNLCQKAPLHWLFGTPPKAVTFSSDVDPVSGLSELDISELRAHAAELRCLTTKLKAMTCDSKCKATVIRRIKQIINQSLPSIHGGSYGSE